MDCWFISHQTLLSFPAPAAEPVKGDQKKVTPAVQKTVENGNQGLTPEELILKNREEFIRKRMGGTTEKARLEQSGLKKKIPGIKSDKRHIKLDTESRASVQKVPLSFCSKSPKPQKPREKQMRVWDMGGNSTKELDYSYKNDLQSNGEQMEEVNTDLVRNLPQLEMTSESVTKIRSKNEISLWWICFKGIKVNSMEGDLLPVDYESSEEEEEMEEEEEEERVVVNEKSKTRYDVSSRRSLRCRNSNYTIFKSSVNSYKTIKNSTLLFFRSL